MYCFSPAAIHRAIGFHGAMNIRARDPYSQHVNSRPRVWSNVWAHSNLYAFDPRLRAQYDGIGHTKSLAQPLVSFQADGATV